MNSLPNDTKRESCPTHPGEMLREKFMPEYDLTATSLADALGVSRKSVSDLLNERRALTPAMALRLARLFGNGPEFWLNAQQAVDLWHTEQKYRDKLAQIQQIHVNKGASKT
ncbi:MAG: addiction module antidote protein, HigA family [Candidatus Parabeggiatoa sp. nov. 2]|nr:MAG: addiction module antidote protein, HigA family [Beggiatoa sp. 4572_84]RKZ61267.1 MAG: addiction module antidote protein, HigA family [Gammaproteobacteria bacterium]